MDKHGFSSNKIHNTDFDISKLKVPNLDHEYVMSIRIRTIRNLRGYCLPPFATRGERRDIEGFLVKSLYQMDDEYNGAYYSIKNLTKDEEIALE